MEKDQLFLLLVFIFNLLLQSLSQKSSGVCISPGGRFHPFLSDGKPPRKVRDLTLCRVFQKKTCCDVSHTHSALLSIRKLASTGEANQECLQLWELLDCSVCDPNVGVKPGPPLICASFCERLYQACSDAYFSMDAIRQVIAPCGVGDFVCGRASEWVSNGTELCRAAGFAVQPKMGETSCYGGKTSLDSISDSWKSSPSAAFEKNKQYAWLKDFQQWMTQMPIIERVSWAVAGLVLTAGLLFMSKRKSYGLQQKNAAAIIRAARLKKLETEPGQISPTARRGQISPTARGGQISPTAGGGQISPTARGLRKAGVR